MSQSESHIDERDDHSMLQRPESHLNALSVALKWETTRRHPLYGWLWDTWRIYQRDHGDEAATRFQGFFGCQWAWLMLCINGIPADPGLEFEELCDTETNPLWLKRSARPVTYRLLAKLLGANLSSSSLQLLSCSLYDAAKTEVGSNERDQAVMSINRHDWPEWDALVDLPLLYYEPSAPSKEFISDITNLRNEMRSKLGIKESRTNESKLGSYLAAWDAREGWCNGAYDRSAPKTLKNVASELGISERNAKYAYQQGFQLISGHPFTFENWTRLIGVLHLSKLFGGKVNAVSLARLRHTPSVRGTDDSTLSSKQTDCEASVLENISSNENSFNAKEVIGRINDMIRSGCTNDQILADLEFEAIAEPGIDELRSIIEMEGC